MKISSGYKQNKINQFIYILLLFLIVINSFSQSNICNATLEPTLNMRIVNKIPVPYQNGIPLQSFEKQNNISRKIIDLKGTWKELRFAADHDISLKKRDDQTIEYLSNNPIPNITSPDYIDNINGWIEKEVPSVVEKMNGEKPPEYYSQGGVWFRKHFKVSKDKSEKLYKLIFYSVNYVADVWLNGKYLGYHEGGYTPFAFDITNEINFDNDNIISVRVDNPPQESRCDIIPCNSLSHWCHYTGIIHDVYIEVSNPISTVRADVLPLDTAGNIDVTSIINNSTEHNNDILVEIGIYKSKIDQDNIQSEISSDLIENEDKPEVSKIVKLNFLSKSTKAFKVILKIVNPLLWFPNSPYLYIIKILIKDSQNKNLLDEYYSQFGIRKLEVQGYKVLLNNKPVFLTGINRTEDHPVYGRSIPINIIYQDLVMIHNLNCDWMRTDHYSNHPYTYLTTDRLGIAVTEELPLMWFEKDAWDCQEKRNIHKQMFREMVLRDFNRPSIFMWSLCNEGVYLSKREDFINWVKNDKDVNYPDGRLITEASSAQCSDDSQNPESGIALNDLSENLCDIAGYTTYHGEYYNKCEETYKYQYYSRTNSFLEEFHQKFNKPLVTFEFGMYLGKNFELLDTQKTIFEEKFRSFSQHAAFTPDNKFNCDGFMMAVTFWTSFDFWVGDDDQWQGHYGVYNMDRKTSRPVLEELKKAYEPYFKMGGVYNGDISNCNK